MVSWNINMRLQFLSNEGSKFYTERRGNIEVSISEMWEFTCLKGKICGWATISSSPSSSFLLYLSLLFAVWHQPADDLSECKPKPQSYSQAPWVSQQSWWQQQWQWQCGRSQWHRCGAVTGWPIQRVLPRWIRAPASLWLHLQQRLCPQQERLLHYQRWTC